VLLRDRLLAYAWQVLNHLDRQLPGPATPGPLRTAEALNLLDHFIMALAALGGVAMESMTRGHGWRFLDLGRRLERAIQMVTLIQHGFGFHPAGNQGQLEVLLEIANSALTYRSRYLTSMQSDLVLDLLLLDDANPRSVAFQVGRLCAHIERLPAGQRAGRRTTEWRLALQLATVVEVAELTELAKADQTGRWTNLETLLKQIATDLPKTSAALTHKYFDHSIISRKLAGP
jgi:uncharacterized alpha-E superfamily protein